jgi:hypothetical protein
MAGLKHAGIIDSEKALMIAALDGAAGERQAAKQYLEDQNSHNIYAYKGYINTVDSIARLGRPLSWEKFEALLKKLPHGNKLLFGEFSMRPFRCVSFQFPDGTIHGISAYGRVPNIPEYSTMNLEREAVPDFNVNHLNHKDFGEMKWVGDPVIGLNNYRNQTGYQTVDGSLKPGWTYRDKFIGENPLDPYSRGWRTVLCKGIALAQLKIIEFASPAQIEAIFGETDSPQWAKHSGNQNIISPF